MKWTAITHYKAESERLPSTHHREFHKGQTLVDLKISQLIHSGVDHIYCSTDDETVDDDEWVTYIHRDSHFCNNVTPFTEVLEEIYQSIPLPDDEVVCYTTTCTPLFSRYDELFTAYCQWKVNQAAVYPSVHNWLDVNRRPANFDYGIWYQYSQDRLAMYQLPHCGVMATLGDFRKSNFVLPQKFDYFEIDFFESIDIDTLEEFELAQYIYEKRHT